MIHNVMEILITFYLASLTIGMLLTQGVRNAEDKAVREDEEVRK